MDTPLTRLLAAFELRKPTRDGRRCKLPQES